MDQVDAGHHPKQFDKHMIGAAAAGGAEIDLARIGFRIGDEFGDRVRRNATDGTTITNGVRPMLATATMSRRKSKFRLV